MKKIKENKIRCNICGDVIVSKSRHDFKKCSCGACAVDGGTDYIRREYELENCYEELTVYMD